MKRKSMDEQYPGFSEQSRKFDEAELPSCPHCGSTDTASVKVGVTGRTINLAGTTMKFKLVPNAEDRKGEFFCNECEKFFDLD